MAPDQKGHVVIKQTNKQRHEEKNSFFWFINVLFKLCKNQNIAHTTQSRAASKIHRVIKQTNKQKKKNILFFDL